MTRIIVSDITVKYEPNFFGYIHEVFFRKLVMMVAVISKLVFIL
jgi:hypothetical protein